jgi:hypothetical protein
MLRTKGERYLVFALTKTAHIYVVNYLGTQFMAIIMIYCKLTKLVRYVIIRSKHSHYIYYHASYYGVPYDIINTLLFWEWNAKKHIRKPDKSHTNNTTPVLWLM